MMISKVGSTCAGLIALVILSAHAASPAFEDHTREICVGKSHTQQERRYQGYHVRIARTDDGFCGLLDIKKNGQLIFHDEGIGEYFWLGSDWQKNIKPFSRLTGGKDSNLLISKWTGGAHCCFSLHIFRLDSEFKKIAVIEGGNYYPLFEDLDKDGVFEIKVVDDFLTGYFSSFAYSATADVVLKYTKGSYLVAPEYMVKAVPNLKVLGQKIPQWREMIQKHDNPDWPPPPFIQVVTEFVFSGNKKAAVALIEQAWPVGASGKKEFLASYEEALKESRFYGDFIKQLR